GVRTGRVPAHPVHVHRVLRGRGQGDLEVDRSALVHAGQGRVALDFVVLRLVEVGEAPARGPRLLDLEDDRVRRGRDGCRQWREDAAQGGGGRGEGPPKRAARARAARGGAAAGGVPLRPPRGPPSILPAFWPRTASGCWSRLCCGSTC